MGETVVLCSFLFVFSVYRVGTIPGGCIFHCYNVGGALRNTMKNIETCLSVRPTACMTSPAFGVYQQYHMLLF